MFIVSRGSLSQNFKLLTYLSPLFLRLSRLRVVTGIRKKYVFLKVNIYRIYCTDSVGFEVKVTFTLEQALKAQRGSTVIALLFHWPRR